ncbi:hypothetical protein BDW02DRAFT_100311 [Decorospora gaudefroyi]|uniref:Uncharacterized protein n=1 Tax=Decorospora gaudefroyi TaxID=184978 RepID=A0A6A5KAS4_9PLEO|nr:hypothetical protein BDW02DRAFT_100311 [Decorospora gaudefroyi]
MNPTRSTSTIARPQTPNRASSEEAASRPSTPRTSSPSLSAQAPTPSTRTSTSQSTRASKSSSNCPSATPSRKSTKPKASTTFPTPLIPICNNGAPIQLPLRLPRRISTSQRQSSPPSPSTSSSKQNLASPPPLPRPKRVPWGAGQAGNVGKFDETTFQVEVELSSVAAKKAEGAFWWIGRR